MSVTDLITDASLMLNGILAFAAILSAYVARQSTTRQIEEERTPMLDTILAPPGGWKKEDIFIFRPVYLINLGPGVATDIVAEASGKFVDKPQHPFKRSFLLPFDVTHNDHEFSFATAKSLTSRESYEPSRIEVAYSDVTRKKHWQYTAKIVQNEYGILIVADQETRRIK